ncbi:MAG TPA: glycosyltransferase family 39 protein [Methylomirabilota bacterium]|nr:glycosyltransferase family 39 protein [Methylomirabilota bacterium]
MKKSVISSRYKFISYAILFCCIALAVFIAFYNLGKSPLENWDEAWYAEVTKQMLRTKDFIMLHWNHAIWLEKPPMFFWLSTFFSTLFGLSELSVRLTSALSGVAVILLVLVVAYRSYGLIPALLAFSSIAFNNVFIWRARTGNIDAFVSLLIFLSYFILLSKSKYKYPLLGFIFACIFLTKASLVFFPFVIFLLYEIVFRLKDIKKNYLDYIKLFSVFFVFSGIWLTLGYLRIGPEFVSYYLFKSDQGVAHIDFTKFNHDYVSYIYYSLQRRFFWVFLLGAGVALIQIRKQKEFLLLLYAFLLLLQLSFTAKSNNWYLVPSMPFWSLLIAYGIYYVIKLVRNNRIVIGLIILASFYISYKTLVGNILPIVSTGSTYDQRQSSQTLNELTKPTDTLVRLDYLYPTTIYYTDRHVLVSAEGDEKVTDGYWINRRDLLKAIEEKKIKWLVGEKSSVQQFQTQAKNLEFNSRQINNSEVILEAQ